MTESFLERYRAGDSVGVWDDLLALGPEISSEAYAADAHAVARETMLRVRRNLATIHTRLLSLGYRFQEPDAALVPPPRATASLLEEVEGLLDRSPCHCARSTRSSGQSTCVSRSARSRVIPGLLEPAIPSSTD